MKKLLFFLLLPFHISVITPTTVFSQLNHQIRDNKSRRNYQVLLLNLYDKILKNRKITERDIAFIIPRSDSEFVEYYSYSYPKKGTPYNKGFEKLESIIGKMLKNEKVLIRYLELSSYVDGEYAEGYFDDVDFIAVNNKNTFCRIYNALTTKSKKQLYELHKQYCKK